MSVLALHALSAYSIVKPELNIFDAYDANSKGASTEIGGREQDMVKHDYGDRSEN